MDGNGKAQLPDLGSESSQEPKIAAVAGEMHVETIPIYDMLAELNYED